VNATLLLIAAIKMLSYNSTGLPRPSFLNFVSRLVARAGGGVTGGTST